MTRKTTRSFTAGTKRKLSIDGSSRSQDAIRDVKIEKDFGAYWRRLEAGGARFAMVAWMIAGHAAHVRDPSDNPITISCYEDDKASDEIVYARKETITID